MARIALLAITGGLLATTFASDPAAAQAPEATVSRLIVKLRDGGAVTAQAETAVRLDRIAADAARAGVMLSRLRPMALGAQVMAMDRRLGRDTAEALAARLALNPDVEYVQPDYRRHASRMPSDPRFSSQWYLASAVGGIDAVDAWDVTTGSPSVVVAFVDTGYRPHPDLAGRMLPGYDFISDPKLANDGGGRDADATDPGDWVDASDLADPTFSDCKIEDSSWHGTAVAGIIGADSDNSLFVTGIDWAAKLLPVRVLGKCGGYDSDILDGIAWAAGLAVPGAPPNPYPAQVINLSLGGDGACTAGYHSTLSAALAHGVTRAIVAAAGNGGSDVSTHTPASCSEVIAVAATTRLADLAGYSNYGAGVAVSAPGGELSGTTSFYGITVLLNTGTTGPGADTWAKVSGTSFSAPMVASVASLVLALAPGLTAAQLRTLLTSTAAPFPAGASCTPANCGGGIVNARTAVLAAQGTSAAPNYQGMWWNAPAGSEPGWGLNVAHQGDTIFASWFTYDPGGAPLWLVAVADKTGPGIYEANNQLYRPSGPRFDAYDAGQWKANPPVGSIKLTFSDGNNAKFDYDVTLPGRPEVRQSKAITREPLGAGPFATCAYGTQPLAAATNYQDMWWAGTSTTTPPGPENGWGINLAQQGDTIFASWFTFDPDGAPLWLVATADKTGPGTYAANDQLYRPSGPRFDAYDPGQWKANPPVGSIKLTFSDGNNAKFDYDVTLPGRPEVKQSKAITRQLFSTYGTTCR